MSKPTPTTGQLDPRDLPEPFRSACRHGVNGNDKAFDRAVCEIAAEAVDVGTTVSLRISDQATADVLNRLRLHLLKAANAPGGNASNINPPTKSDTLAKLVELGEGFLTFAEGK